MVTKCAQVILSLLSPVILLQSYGESEDLRNEVTLLNCLQSRCQQRSLIGTSCYFLLPLQGE